MCLYSTSDTRSLAEVITSIVQRVGDDIDPMNLPQILVSFKMLYLYSSVSFFLVFLMQAGQFFLQYEDEDNDKVVLASDSDLAAAVDHAKTAGLKV